MNTDTGLIYLFEVTCPSLCLIIHMCCDVITIHIFSKSPSDLFKAPAIPILQYDSPFLIPLPISYSLPPLLRPEGTM